MTLPVDGADEGRLTQEALGGGNLAFHRELGEALELMVEVVEVRGNRGLRPLGGSRGHAEDRQHAEETKQLAIRHGKPSNLGGPLQEPCRCEPAPPRALAAFLLLTFSTRTSQPLGRTNVTDAARAQPNVPNIAFLTGTFFIALVGTPWFVIARGLRWPEVIVGVAIWLAVGISVTAGYHRLFTHKTYQAAWPVRLFYLVFGAAAFENSVLNWAADHRVHHSNVDHDRDPYNIQKGFWWAHIGWIFYVNEPIPRTVVRDLLEDPLVCWQHRWYQELGVAVAFG